MDLTIKEMHMRCTGLGEMTSQQKPAWAEAQDCLGRSIASFRIFKYCSSASPLWQTQRIFLLVSPSFSPGLTWRLTSSYRAVLLCSGLSGLFLGYASIS